MYIFIYILYIYIYIYIYIYMQQQTNKSKAHYFATLIFISLNNLQALQKLSYKHQVQSL